MKKVEICITKDNKAGIKGEKEEEVLYVENNSIKRTNSIKECIVTDFSISTDLLTFRNIEIKLPFSSEELNLLKALYIVTGKAKHEVLTYDKKVKIHVDIPFRELKLSQNVEVKFTRFCGDYGLLFPHYCISMNNLAIYGHNREKVIEAYVTLKELVEEVGKVLLKLKEREIE
ncbi:MAG: hypothetical protein RXR08_04240 [Sulfolobaceae archaeon]